MTIWELPIASEEIIQKPNSLHQNRTTSFSPCPQATLTEVDRHDNAYWYHKLTLQQLQDLVPQFNWLQYLSSFLTIKIDSDESLVSYSTPYFIEMGKILEKTSRR